MKIENKSTSNLSIKLNRYLQSLAIALEAKEAALTLSIYPDIEGGTDTKISLYFSDNSSAESSHDRVLVERKMSFNMPFSNNGKVFAKAAVHLPNHVFNAPEKRDKLKSLVSEIERLIIRQKVRNNARAFLDESLSFCGNSKSLTSLEQDLYLFSRSPSNLALFGGKGSGKVIAALIVHTLNSHQNGPFVKSNLSDWKNGDLFSYIERYAVQAIGGTLYIRCGEIISKKILKSIATVANFYSDCRIILGITAIPDNAELRANASSDWSQDFATIEIPSLNQRKSDIPALVDDFINKQQLATRLTISEDCISLLENYIWKNGVKQLHKLLLNAILENTESQITADSLIYCCPELRSPDKNNNLETDKNVEHFVGLNTYSETFGHDYHPAIKRALSFICQNHKTQFDLKTIAAHSCVSPSHLSFLVKSQFGLSPMQLVNRYKVERAKAALLDVPNKQITEISSELGFWDLSHFEKVFKRWTGVTPKQFRNRLPDDSKISLLLRSKTTL